MDKKLKEFQAATPGVDRFVYYEKTDTWLPKDTRPLDCHRNKNAIAAFDKANEEIQERWYYWCIAWEKASVRPTMETELWKNPFISVEERLEIAEGAIAFRNEVIRNLQDRLVSPTIAEFELNDEMVEAILDSDYTVKDFDRNSESEDGIVELRYQVSNNFHTRELARDTVHRIINALKQLTPVKRMG
ncbi:hypothetical protein [Pseudomonas phage U1B]|nr:hypothetical protein [Pseudomonas phage T2P]QYV99189.1 hypothetical protein [Pseudomonas phage U1B]QYV99644.1 hypothetical protein [Pseudomonas phage U5]